jgi:hypothetical protein
VSRGSVALVAVSAAATAALLLVPVATAADVTLPLVLVATAALAWCAFREADRPTLPAGFVFVVAAVLAILAVLCPPHGSRDVWAYVMYGRIHAVHHANPYVALPQEFSADPFFDRMAPYWWKTTSVYGPWFTLLSSAIAGLGRHSAFLSRAGFQLAAAAAHLFVGAVLVRRRAPVWVLLAVLLNPLVLVTVVNGGHNDALVGAALLGAALAADRRHPMVAGLALSMAIGVKAVAVIPAAALLLWWWWKGERRAAAVTAVSVAVPTLAGFALFGGMAPVRSLLAASSHVSRPNFWRLVQAAGRVTDHPVSRSWIGMASLVLVAAVTAVLVRPRLRDDHAAGVLAAGAAGYLFAAAYVLPWYVMWALPVAALAAVSTAGGQRVLALVLSLGTALLVTSQYRAVARPDLLDRALGVIGAVAQVAFLAVCAALLLDRPLTRQVERR